MKNQLASLTLAFVLSAQLCPAQINEPADDWKPATSNQRGKQFPQVNSEGRVRDHLAVAARAQDDEGGGLLHAFSTS